MSLPDSMLAAVITAPGGPDVLQLQSRPLPVPGTGEILVRVRASALNRADLIQRAGRYAAPPGVPADIPGLEFAGEVVASGPNATLWPMGFRVAGLVGGGAHAEFLVTHERAVAAVPDGVDWATAGAAPEACITAHDALVSQADVRPGETVLIHAAGSGVGLAAIQIARQLGARVFGTARGAEKLAAARDAGMEDGVSPGPPGWVASAVRQWTEGRGIDVALDLVGGDYVRETIPAMALKGRVILIGMLAGTESSLDLRAMLSRRLTVRGTMLRSRPLEERIAVTGAFAREVMPWLVTGAVGVRIDAGFPLADIADAHRLLESNGTIGKVAIACGTASDAAGSEAR
jgi:putative PIG3 family NAD(P)H quinone oxidoreductase